MVGEFCAPDQGQRSELDIRFIIGAPLPGNQIGGHRETMGEEIACWATA